jgi:hypothetical protein
MTPAPRRTLALAAAAALAGMGGCSSTPAPEISVLGVSPSDRTPDGVLMLVRLEAQSTAEDALPLREVSYRVRLDGREVFRGSRSPEATLRRFGSQTLLLPVVFPSADGPAPAGRYEVEGTLRYAEPGTIAEVLLDLGVRTPSVSFRGSGQVGPAESAK